MIKPDELLATLPVCFASDCACRWHLLVEIKRLNERMAAVQAARERAERELRSDLAG